jgi:putative FmdB family regulatory protein
MPLYDYKCTKCGKVREVRHGFDERHAEACPDCGGALARVFNPAPIVFKGSGFYVTDSRKSSSPGESKADAPKADAPKADAAKTDAPKTDAAKSDTPKSDGAGASSPKTESKASEPAA